MRRLFMIYFSATENTKKIVEAIGEAYDGYEKNTIDLTKPENREKTWNFTKEDTVILGTPVYGGRIPTLKEPLFLNLNGSGGAAVLAVTYGNRAYDDALLELKDISQIRGFFAMGAGAFVGEHTYSFQMAGGRPDDHDLAAALELGKKAREIGERKDMDLYELTVPGNSEYRKGMGFIPFVPKANRECTHCGLCVKKCPTGAIKASNPKRTSMTRCIRCFACVKYCPEKCRSLKSRMFWKKIHGLEAAFRDKVCEAELFYAERQD